MDGEDWVELMFKSTRGMDVGVFLCIDCAYETLSKYGISDFEEVKMIKWNGKTWRMEIHPDRMTVSDIEELMELIKDRKLFPEEVLSIPPSLTFFSQHTSPNAS